MFCEHVCSVRCGLYEVRAACFLEYSSASFAKRLDGKEGCISLNLLLRGELRKMVRASSLIDARKDCFMADLLTGRVIGVLVGERSEEGSR